MDLHALLEQQGPLEPGEAVGWLIRLADALAQLHSRGLAHGAVSPHALATASRDPRARASLKSPLELMDRPAYRSADRGGEGAPSPADDVWAAGVTLYELLTAKVPFRGESFGQVKARIGWSPPTPLAKRGCKSRSLQHILDRLFSPYRVNRISTARDLRIALERTEKWRGELVPLELPPDTSGEAHRFVVSSRPPPPSLAPPSLRALEGPPTVPASEEPGESDAPSLGPNEETSEESAVAARDEDDERPTLVYELSAIREQVAALEAAEARGKAESPSEPPQEPPSDPAGGGSPSIPEISVLDPVEEPSVSQRMLAAWLEADDRSREAPQLELTEGDESLAHWIEQEAPGAKDVLDELRAMAEATDLDAQRQDAKLASAPREEKPRDEKVSGPRDEAPKVVKKKKKRKSRTSAAPAARPKSEPPMRARAASLVPTEPRRRNKLATPLLAAAALAAAAAYVGMRGSETAAETAPAPASSAIAPSAAPAASASGAAVPASARPAASIAADPQPCLRGAFPEDAFTGPTDLSAICSESAALAGARMVRRRLVLAGQGRDVTDAMVEWAQLGWWDMAAFSAIRARCCASPPPLEQTQALGLCGIVEALRRIEEGVRAGDEQGVSAGADAYHVAAKCLWGRDPGALGYPDAPHIQQRTTFEKIAARLAR